MSDKQKVAVIGGGVAGVVSAWRLSKRYEVTIFEAGSYLGGHTNTVIIPEGVDEGTPVDTGFIVLNDKTYPLFTKFLAELDIATRYADMSFSVYCPSSNLQYCSRDINVLFAQRSNFFNRRFLGMLLDIKRFWSIASLALKDNSLANKTLLEFLEQHRFGVALREDFLYPLAAAVWSSSDKQLDNFPAETFLTFFRNHGWLSYLDQPRWQTVVAGSRQYLKSFQTLFNGNIYLDSAVLQIKNFTYGNGQEVLLRDGRSQVFDKVVIATHADQVLPLLGDASEDEMRVFSSWAYSNNITLLHNDQSFMPPLKRAWGAWNYRKEPSNKGIEPVSVTYHMNNLQGLNCSNDYFVTLNPRVEPKNGSILKQFNYTHPIFTSNSVKSQLDLQSWNGQNGRWYCGSYCGYGFHEDAVRSAELIANKILT
jgi:predicted NAD/FAD-binding protein